MLLNLSRAWACSLVLGFLGLVVAGTAKNSAHWRGQGAFFWLALLIGIAGGLGAAVGTARPFRPWLPLLLTVSLPAPVALVVLGLLVRGGRGFDVPFLTVAGSMLLVAACACAAAVGVWQLRRRLSSEPWTEPAPRIGQRDRDPAGRPYDAGHHQG